MEFEIDKCTMFIIKKAKEKQLKELNNPFMKISEHLERRKITNT